MPTPQDRSTTFDAYVRWRPLPVIDNASSNAVEYNTTKHENKSSILLSAQPNAKRPQCYSSGCSFAHVFSATCINSDIYKAVVEPTLPLVLNGTTCNFFAYGHSGSGKTYTIIGYDHENDQQLGLVFATAQNLFEQLAKINNAANSLANGVAPPEIEFILAVRLYEVRSKLAHDLFNGGLECHIREGPDGQTHIRGATEVLAGGKVRVRPIVARPCSSFAQLREAILSGLDLRQRGSSEVHDESSRTHAILEMEIVDQQLLDLRTEVVEREAELVPVGKRATDVYIEEQMKSLIKKEDGTYAQNPDCPLNQTRIDEVEAEKKLYQDRVDNAEEAVAAYFSKVRSEHACVGGKYTFIDLAGAEYFDRPGNASGALKQSPQERQQGRQINSDLFALKEVIRAKATAQSRIPYRSSPLTMVLRSHFEGGNGTHSRSAMILTLSSEDVHIAATMNTVKYGNLVGLTKSLDK